MVRNSNPGSLRDTHQQIDRLCFIVLGHMARGRAEVYAAAELADGTGIAMPTVSKVLKSLTRAGVVRSSRGAHGAMR